jgi:hypothetical protein
MARNNIRGRTSMMLQIVPTSWWSWDVKVSDEARPVADIAMSWWREKGALAIDGARYRVYREAPLSGAFVLAGAGGVLARAEKPSVFRREFVVRHAGREYTLRPRSMFRRAFVLLDGSREVGSLAPQSAFTRKAAADLPHDLPLPVRAFIVWLILVSWRRAQDS